MEETDDSDFKIYVNMAARPLPEGDAVLVWVLRLNSTAELCQLTVYGKKVNLEENCTIMRINLQEEFRLIQNYQKKSKLWFLTQSNELTYYVRML